MYRAHVRRKAIEEATAYKNSMVGGLYANSNLDDGKHTRQNILDEIEAKHYDAINLIYNGKSDEEIDFEEDPLFAAIKLDDSIPTTDTTEFETDQD